MLASPKLPALDSRHKLMPLSPGSHLLSDHNIFERVASKTHISLDPFFSPRHLNIASMPSSPALRPAKRPLIPIYPRILEEEKSVKFAKARGNEPKHRQVLRAMKDIRTYLPPVLATREEVTQKQRRRVLSFS